MFFLTNILYILVVLRYSSSLSKIIVIFSYLLLFVTTNISFDSRLALPALHKNTSCDLV